MASISEPIHTARLLLEKLSSGHAEEAAATFDDMELHEFTGGRPSTSAELRERYSRLEVASSPDGTQRWLNWMMRDVESGQLVGTVQATIEGTAYIDAHATIAWVVGLPFQRRGFAIEGARSMVARLEADGVVGVSAYIHPDHVASAAIARALGLTPTGEIVGGEIRWSGQTGAVEHG